MLAKDAIVGRSARIAFAIMQLVFLGLLAGETLSVVSTPFGQNGPDDSSLVGSQESGADSALSSPQHHLAGAGVARTSLPSACLAEPGTDAPAPVGSRVHRAIPLLLQAPKLSPPA